MWKKLLVVAFLLAGTGLLTNSADAAALESRVNEAFRSVYGRNPNVTENNYWRNRVIRGDKKTFAALRGAMGYHKARGSSTGTASSKSSVAGMATKTTTNRTQLIKDVLPLFVKIYGSNPASSEKAWWRKRISCGEINSTTELTKSMKFHKAKGARKGSPNICGIKTSSSGSSSGVNRKAVAGISNHVMGDQVRIGIFKTDGSPIVVTANGKYQVREGASKVLGTVGKDDTVEVSYSGGKYHVRGALNADTNGKIRLVPLNQAIMQIKNYNDKSTTIPGKNYNRFRGIIEVRKCDGCSELWAINELRTEYYLRGLAETSGNGPEEYIKALGVAARTYVLYHKVVTGGRNEALDYTIGKTSDDQIYRGYEYEIITPRMSSIFNKTKGIIVTDKEGDKPVSAVYFSDSDGRTRTAKEVWNTSRFPHLQKSVKDPYHVSSSCNGHCVGMSAQGAYGFAKAEGWSMQKILNYYFQNVKIVKAY